MQSTVAKQVRREQTGLIKYLLISVSFSDFHFNVVISFMALDPVMTKSSILNDLGGPRIANEAVFYPKIIVMTT